MESTERQTVDRKGSLRDRFRKAADRYDFKGQVVK
jgi:hypothetical protein